MIVLLLDHCGSASILSVGFEQILLQRDAVGAEAAEVLDTFVYYHGVVDGDWGVAAAAGLFKGVVGVLLVLTREQGRPSPRRTGGVPAMTVTPLRPPWMEEPTVAGKVSKAAALSVVLRAGLLPFLVVLSTSLSSQKASPKRG